MSSWARAAARAPAAADGPGTCAVSGQHTVRPNAGRVRQSSTVCHTVTMTARGRIDRAKQSHTVVTTPACSRTTVHARSPHVQPHRCARHQHRSAGTSKADSDSPGPERPTSFGELQFPARNVGHVLHFSLTAGDARALEASAFEVIPIALDSVRSRASGALDVGTLIATRSAADMTGLTTV